MWRHQIEQYLADHLGTDAASLGEERIRQAVLARQKALALDSPDRYPEILRARPEEETALFEELVVPESWFFRDGQPFERLRRFVRGLDRRPVRLLSVPCAGGEEPYSLAIALLDAGLNSAEFRIDAVDVSQRALDKARRGVYRPISFRGSPIPQADRWFMPHRDGWEVRPLVRESVCFVRGNLLATDFLSGRSPYDVIFCRNLLIYMTEPARRQAVGTLERLLRLDGLLVVGHAESLAVLRHRFQPDEERGSFAYRRCAEPAAPHVETPTSTRVPSVTGPSREVGLPAAARPTFSTPALDERTPSDTPSPSERLPEPPAAVVPRRPDADALLDRAAALANQRHYLEAAELCQCVMRDYPLNARAYRLLGMIDLARDRARDAETHLHRAVYLDGNDDEALLALSLLAERRGDRTAAERYRQRAERALALREAP
jgi:chemotaxis protein methyltransferase WspC